MNTLKLWKKFEAITGDKLRAIVMIRGVNGMQEWRGVVDLGEGKPETQDYKGFTRLVRPLKYSNKCHIFFVKDEKIVSRKSFRPYMPPVRTRYEK